MPSQPLTKATIRAIGEQLPIEEMLARVAEGATQRELASLVSERIGRTVSAYYVNRWLKAEEGRHELWKEAKKQAADKYADEVAEAIQAVKSGSMGANEAKTVMSGAQWLASRLSPQQWGDRLEVNANLTDVTSLHLEAMRQAMRTVSTQETEKE
jgi:hypothetical protein